MDIADILSSVASGLNSAAREPNMYGYKPNKGGQIEFHRSNAVGRLLAGDNRSGKSVAGAVETAWWLTGKHPYLATPPPPVKGRVVTVDFDYGADQIIVPKLKQWIPPSELKNGSWEDSYNKNKHLLTLANGSELEIKAHGQKLDSFAGVPRHFLWIDEECPRSIFIESKTRLIDYNGKFWLTMTPVEGITWVYDDLVEKDPINVKLFSIRITDNVHVDEQAIKTLEEDLDEEEKAIRLGRGKRAGGRGNFLPRGGLVFKEFDDNRHIIKPGLPPMDWAIWASVDAGYNNPTAWLWHAVSPFGLVITFMEHYQAEWTAAMHAEKYHEINKMIGRKPWLNVGDPSMGQRSAQTGHSLLTEYQMHGVFVKPGRKQKDLVEIDRMNDYLKNDRWFITENCPNLRREIIKLPWKRYQSPKLTDLNNKREEPLDKDNHATDSAGYFFRFMPDLTAGTRRRVESPTLIRPNMPGTSATNGMDLRYPWRVDTQLRFSSVRETERGWGEV